MYYFHGFSDRGLRWLSCLAAVFFLAAMVCGCGDADRAVVDFEKTLPVARPGNQNPQKPPLRAAVAAMISPKETFDLYRQLMEYLSRRMDKDLEFVQRKTYAEINELLRRGDIDLAFICSGPYATARETFGFQPLAVPLIHGSHFYQSFLIINKDSPFKRLEDLKGRTFAFTDPNSNTGKLVPAYWLAELNERPETFFRQTIYTYSHDNSIMAVSRGLVDGAAVDGLIWEYYQERQPSFTARVKVIRKSEPYGMPPLVASARLAPRDRQRLQQLLLTMHEDEQGKKILAELLIDRFIPLKEEWYQPIRDMQAKLVQLKGKEDETQKP